MSKNHNFSKSYRLLTPTQFREVFDNTERKIHASHLMAFIKTNNLENPRLGLAITKKKVPTAVGRNQIKRLARNNFRLIAHELKNKDIVIIAKKPTKDLTKEELTTQLGQIFAKIKKEPSSNE